MHSHAVSISFHFHFHSGFYNMPMILLWYWNDKSNWLFYSLEYFALDKQLENHSIIAFHQRISSACDFWLNNQFWCRQWQETINVLMMALQQYQNIFSWIVCKFLSFNVTRQHCRNNYSFKWNILGPVEWPQDLKHLI